MQNADHLTLLGLLESAEAEEFYGEIVFKFRQGRVYQINKNQSIQVNDIANRRTDRDGR